MRRCLSTLSLSATVIIALSSAACRRDQASGSLTHAEARQALDEAATDTQASALTTSSVELATSFTLGGAARDAAAEIRAFIEAQLPCAEVEIAEATLSVEYGAKPGACSYRGVTFSGRHTVTVTKAGADAVVVDHAWDELAGGRVSVTGTARVTWSLADETRRVEHDLTWTRLADGRTGRGTGDRTQRALGGDIAKGIAVEGSRSWTGPAGRWDLQIEGVEARWGDPIPQAGTYRLASPKGRSLEAGFARVDDDTIRVTLASDRRSFSFTVDAAGAVADE